MINFWPSQAALTLAGATVTAAADPVTGAVTLTSAGPITLALSGLATLANTGFTSGTTGPGGAVDCGLTTGYKAATATAGAGVSSLDFSTAAGALASLDTLDAALKTVSTARGSLGAYQNRFASTIASLQTTTENLTASRSRIQDADFAKETASLSRAQVLQQAGTAILAQANQSAQGVLSLLR
jgi:flagellin